MPAFPLVVYDRKAPKGLSYRSINHPKLHRFLLGVAGCMPNFIHLDGKTRTPFNNAIRWLIGPFQFQYHTRSNSMELDFRPVSVDVIRTLGAKQFHRSPAAIHRLGRRVLVLSVLASWYAGRKTSEIPTAYFPHWVPSHHIPHFRRLMDMVRAVEFSKVL
jgi:hypothetical protein